MPNNTPGAEGRCGHVYPNGRTCGFPPGSHHGDGCQHHPFTPPVAADAQGLPHDHGYFADGCKVTLDGLVADERARRREGRK
jgi:hypothetical protein